MFKKIKEESQAFNVAISIINDCKSDIYGVNEALVYVLRDIYLVMHFSKDEKSKAYIQKLSQEDVFVAHLEAKKDKIFAKEFFLFDSKAKKDYLNQLDKYIESFKSNALREWEYNNGLYSMLNKLAENTPSVKEMEGFVEKIPTMLKDITKEDRDFLKDVSKMR